MKNKIKAYHLGHRAEYWAIFMLICKGYRIKERRYKSPYGEIDIIAKRGKLTVFCEVKARKDYMTAIESLSNHQKMRIVRSAQYYMAGLKTARNMNKIENELYRCDMILIIPKRWPIHIINAW